MQMNEAGMFHRGYLNSLAQSDDLDNYFAFISPEVIHNLGDKIFPIAARQAAAQIALGWDALSPSSQRRLMRGP
jgi:hypothetical protein